MKFIFVPGERLRDWYKRPEFKRGWLVAGLLIGILPAFGILLPNLVLLAEYPTITVFLILFALINPWFEEGYWRGLILDAGKDFPQLTNILYSTFFFVLSHPPMWGVFSIANRSYQMFIALFVMGIIWSLIRLKTGSLRWPVYSHLLVDVGNLSVFVPPGM